MSCTSADFDGQFGRLGLWINSGTLNLDASAYTDEDCAFDNYITFSCAGRSEGKSGTIKAIKIVSDNNGTTGIVPAGDLYLFNVAPANQTKNSAYTMTAAEAAALQAKITLATGEVSDDLGVIVLREDHYYECASTDTALYGIFTIEGALDFATSATATIYLYVEKN